MLLTKVQWYPGCHVGDGDLKDDIRLHFAALEIALESPLNPLKLWITVAVLVV